MKATALMTALLFSFNAFAIVASPTSRINRAVELLSQGADGGNSEYTFKTKSGDVKEIIKELALSEGTVESAEEFEDSYTTTDEAWAADSLAFAAATLGDAETYVIDALEQKIEEGQHTDAEKVKFADNYFAAKQGISILRSLKDKVKFGVVPFGGAVQCGVTFPALLIIDLNSGKATTVSMEGSGC